MAEESIIGTLMGHNSVDAMGVVFDEFNMKPEHFFVPSNKTLIAAIMEMDRQFMSVNLVTFMQYLTDKGLLNEVGGPSKLIDCGSVDLGAGTALFNLRDRCKIVKDKADLRNLLKANDDIKDFTLKNADTVKDAIGFAQKTIGELEWSGEDKKSHDIKVINEEAFNYVEQISTGKVAQTGIPYGFDRLDELTGGACQPDMTVLAARPGIGKTALALTFMRYMASIGRVPGFWSLEMTSKQLQMRNLAAVAKVPHLAMRRGQLKEEDLEKVRHARNEMSEWNVRIDDWSGHTISSISAKARKWKREFGMDIIFIDYLQLINPDDPNQWNRADQVSTISRGIKGLAKQLEVPTIVLAQLSRAAEDGEEPRLSQLRESGAIEQDADNVLFLWKPEDQKNKSSNGKRIIDYNLSIAKQRSGPTDKIPLKYYEWMTLFEEVPKKKEDEE